MPDQVSTFESHRVQLAASLVAVADSMRNCAQMADTFAKVVSDSTYSPETAEMLQGALDGFTKGKKKAALSPEEEDGSKKRKRNTKPKDPNAPKRPASSYILFQNQVRKTLKDTHPGLTNAELLQMISDQWKAMTPEQKEPYNQIMREAKTQYTDDKKAYENRTPEEIEAANAAATAAALAKKANAKPRGPKRAAATAATAADAADVIAKARPPPTSDQMVSSDSSEEDQSDEEDTAEPDHAADSDNSDADEDEDDDTPEPAPKKRRSPSTQPKEKEHKKKSSKA